ncbi:phosphoglycolate phosphatase [Streptomyces chumphonensis]|uniref:HAD family hydrolase n=1 Tax=Streptomyces chumphonensis TaxID=1214925 RepID=A0A927IBY3_9ACTN|nr:HAD family hydrolase [Streptomyces chumphonensis]MBD3933433.1 HAD family hydrolase [Streptomyces chumphonensis]
MSAHGRVALRAALFDLDGTLADTPCAIGRLLVRVCAEHGRRVTPERARPTIGTPLEAAFAELLALPATDPEICRAVRRYRALFEEDVLGSGRWLVHAGVREGLERLHEAGLPLAVATSKIAGSAHALLDAMEISAHFPVVIGQDMVGRGKPDPEMGLAAATALGVPADRCAYVGDTTTDLRMARAAGMLPVGVTYGIGGRAELTALAAPAGGAVHDSFEDVVDTLLLAERAAA